MQKSLLTCVPRRETSIHFLKGLTAMDFNPGTASRSRTSLSSVANALRLLKAFSDQAIELGISDLAKRLGLAKSTVHRLASSLVEAGLVEQNRETGKYRPGLALFELGSLVRRHMDITWDVRGDLEALQTRTGETVHLAVLDHHSVLFTDSVAASRGAAVGPGGVMPGQRAPAHCTAVGKVLLAFQPSEALDDVLRAGLAACTTRSIVDPEALREEIALVRSRGYAVSEEELEPGLGCLAAPVRNQFGSVVAAAGVAGPVERLCRRSVVSLAPDVMATAAAISARMGHQSRVQVTLQR